MNKLSLEEKIREILNGYCRTTNCECGGTPAQIKALLSLISSREQELVEILKKYKCGEHRKLLKRLANQIIGGER